MKKILKKLTSLAVSLTLAASVSGGFITPAFAAEKSPKYQENARLMEELNRGLIAAYRSKDGRSILDGEQGVFLSWRLLGTESLTNQAFDIYRSTSETGTFSKIHTTGAHDATNYIDTSGAAGNYYKVVRKGESASAEKAVKASDINKTPKGSEVGNGNSLTGSYTYVDIPIDRPDPVDRMGDGKKSYYYSYVDSSKNSHEGGANDASVGDIDGDGDYELILKWDPTDSKDSAGADFTGNVYIDAYEIDPDAKSNSSGNYRKWRIDMGKNVTAGAHYTQFIVYDFDGDGKAEIAMKTAPGTIDGTGKYVTEAGDTAEIKNTDNTKSYIGTSGRLKGKNPFTQFLTVFDGETGEALATTEYIPYEKYSKTYWGDGSAKYNRSERYLAGVGYLDGVHPSIIMCRGYYNEAAIRAYIWDGSELTLQWEQNGAKKGDTSIYGQGNHQLSIADIDNDGKDEIVYGSVAIDDNGVAVGNTYLGHGDALHVSDFNNDGIQEAFSVKEDKEGYTNNAANFRVPTQKQSLWGHGASGDTGRGVMANIDDAYAKEHPNALSLAWSSSHTNVFDLNGNEINAKPASAGSGSFDNSLVFWDGDLSRELLDANIIQKYDAAGGYSKRIYGPSDGYTLVGGTTNNYTKRNASLSADLWGDWREEIIMPINKGDTSGQAYLRIYTSTVPTDYRLTTLMHDSQYRSAIAWQNVGYNQPPHTSYYIGSAALATDENGNELNYLAPETAYTRVITEPADKVDVTGITMTDKNISVEMGKTGTIAYQIEPANATKRGVTWTSGNSSVATVSGGLVKGISEGTAILTATTKDGGFSDTCTVTVYQIHAAGVKLSESTMSVGVGYTKQLTAIVSPDDATDKSVKWTSSDPSVATVDEDGNVTGIALGKAKITAATVDGGYSASCDAEVLPLKQVQLTGNNVFITDNTDANNTFKATAASASFDMNDAASGAKFYKSFEESHDGSAALHFVFDTNGRRYDGTNWNWTGHEYTLKLKILDENGDNIITFAQPYGTGSNGGAGKLTASILDKAAENVEQMWTTDGIGSIQGSSKHWVVDLEFDYDNDTLTPSIVSVDGAGRMSYDSFSLNGVCLGEICVEVVVDGEGAIKAGPAVSDLSYILTVLDDGTPDTRPTLEPTASPEPTPTPTPAPVTTNVTGFIAKSRMTVSEAEGDENTVTFTAASNANNGVGTAYCDYSSYVEGADTYIIEYDSQISSSQRARIALVDAASRPGTSSKSSYDKTGVAFVHGVTDSSSYAAMENKAIGNAPSARDNWVHTSVTVDTVNKTLTYAITSEGGSKLLSGTNVSYLDTDLEAPNSIEYLDTINSSVGYIKNLQVTVYKNYEPEPTAEPTPTAEVKIPAKLIIATYDSDNVLVSAEISDYNYTSGTSEKDLSNSIAENQIAYIWYDIKDMKPVCEPIKPSR